jgi:hypothetical protein
MAKITGSCLCREIKFEIDGALGEAGNCHCAMCRKWTGSAFITAAALKPEALRFISGKQCLKVYDSSPGNIRRFCEKCGSSLFCGSKDESAIFVNLGCVDGDPGVRPKSHISSDQKRPGSRSRTACRSSKSIPKIADKVGQSGTSAAASELCFTSCSSGSPRSYLSTSASGSNLTPIGLRSKAPDLNHPLSASVLAKLSI